MHARHPGVDARSPIFALALAVAFVPVLGAVEPAHAAARSCIVSEAKAVWDAGASDVEAGGAVAAADGILTFTDGTGVVEPVGPTGSISFDGTLVYTSAAGVKTTLSAPTIVIDGTRGTLLFDVQPEGTDLVPQAPLADVDLGAAAVSESGDALNLDGVGAATDPTGQGRDVLWSGMLGGIDLTIAADCATAEASTGPSAVPAPADAEEDAGGTGILVPVIVVGVAALLAALLAVGSVQRRKRNSARAAQPEQVHDPLP